MVGLLAVFFATMLVAFSPQSVFALEVSKIPETEVVGNFMVAPAKIETVVEPGEKQIKYITVLNRFGSDYSFNVEVKDFSPSKDSGGPILGEKYPSSGDFSLKSYIKPEVKSFSLHHGSQARIAINITIPKDTPPGGRYAAVLVSASPRERVPGGTTIVSRIGALLLVKVSGEVKEIGQLINFVFKNGKFLISYRNDGNVHLDPYGVVEVRNQEGVLVETIQIDPWIILPLSTRSRQLVLSGVLPDGIYTAKILLNRGYKDITDIKEVSFRLGPIPITSSVMDSGVDLEPGYYLIGLFIFLCLIFVIMRWS